MSSIQPPFGYIAPSSVAANPANPTAPASTSATFVMQGVGQVITPQTPSGKVFYTATGYGQCKTATTVGIGLAMQLYYGQVLPGVALPVNTGAIPTSAIAVGTALQMATGTTFTTEADANWPFALNGLVSGLTPGQQYWFDIGAYSLVAASDCGLFNLNINIIEIG